MEGINSYEGFGISSTVICMSIRRVCELVERCCSCTRHSTYSTTCLSARACEFRNAGRKRTGCYCWGRCKNKRQLMLSSTTARGLIGNFPPGAEPPAVGQCSSPLPVWLPTTLVLIGDIGGQGRAILAAGAGGGGTRGGMAGRKIPRDSRIGGRGAGGPWKEGEQSEARRGQRGGRRRRKRRRRQRE